MEQEAYKLYLERRARRDQRNVVLAGAAGLGVALLFYFFDPAVRSFFYDCPIYARTGLLCAGCGGQRALHALLHGRVLDALSMNLVAVLAVAPMVLYSYTAWALRVFAGRALPFPEFTLPRALAVGFFLAGYAVLRNTPGFEFLTPP